MENGDHPLRGDFAKLGAAVEKAWRKEQYDEIALEHIASAALREFLTLHTPATADSLLRNLVESESLPFSPLAPVSFGQPALTVFAGERFFVEVLFWNHGTTSVHQHAFSGAFGVLAGASVHCAYSFAPKRRLNNGVLCGSVDCHDTEVLKPGDVRRIRQGADFIHSLFHMVQPSVTVVIRTYNNPDSLPQYTYSPPSLAEDAAPHVPCTADLLRALDAFVSTSGGDPGVLDFAVQLVRRGDPRLALGVARRIVATKSTRAFLEAVLAAAQSIFGDDVVCVERAIIEENRKRALVNMRRRIVDPDLRFILALLLNIPHGQRILAIVSAYCGNAGVPEKLLSWICRLDELGQLRGTRTSGAGLIPATEGHGEEGLIRLQPGDVDRLREALRARFGLLATTRIQRGFPSSVPHSIDVRDILKRCPLLAPLFEAYAPAGNVEILPVQLSAQLDL